MSILDKVLRGSYKGVDFLSTSYNTTGGRKIVKHSFPNSDKQVIEDLGLSPRSYSINITITGDETTYIPNRDRFLRKLEDGESGKLVHPLFGDIENVRVGIFTLNEDDTELGRAKFSVTFEVSEGTGIPERATSSISAVENSNAEVLAGVNVNMAANYQTSTSFPNSYSDSLSKLNDTTTAFTNSTSSVQAAANKINEFNAELQQFQNDITSLVREPQNLANSIQSLFTTVEGLYTTSEAVTKVMEGFYTFGDNDVSLALATASQIERAANRKILNDTLQANALSYSYFHSSLQEFNTVDEIEERADILETQYQKIITSTGLDDDSKQKLTDMRDNVQLFLEEQKLTAAQIITVNTPQTSARLLAYQYYGSSEQGLQIAQLNESLEPTFLEGDVKVLTA